MGGTIVWMVIMCPVSLVFTGIGIYAGRRKEPMWFWSGSTVDPAEITDIPAYNRANSRMWLGFACLLWISTAAGMMNMRLSGILLIAGCILAVPLLPVIYGKIYRTYSVQNTAQKGEKQ